MQTAIAEQFAAKGILAHNVEYELAVAKFQNNGGKYEMARAILDAAYGMGSETQKELAVKGHAQHVFASRPDDGGEGRAKSAVKARATLPSPPSPDRGAGQEHVAEEAMHRMPTAATPRPVSPSYIAAAKKGAKAISLTVLDSFKVRDGRSIGDVPFCALDRLISEGGHEVAVLKLIRNRGRPTDLNSPIRLLVGTQEMQRIIQKAAEMSDAA